MSDNLMIVAEPRTVVGKKVKQLRRDGIIPAIIYGQTDPVSIQLDNLKLLRVLRQASTTHLIDIELDGKKRTVLAREIQQHLTRGDLIHVDFMEVDMKVAISAEVTLVIVGISVPASDGLGSDVLPTHTVEIECLPEYLIAEIEVDVSKIDSPETHLYVRDLDVPEGITMLSDPDLMVARFAYAATAESEDDLLEEGFIDGVEIIGTAEEEEEEA